jgi:hypothetical protein
MKHKNRSSSISLKDFSLKMSNGREWEVFLRLEMEFGVCSCVGRGVGVSIYRWGFKTSHWANFAVEDRLNRTYDKLQVKLVNRS